MLNFIRFCSTNNVYLWKLNKVAMKDKVVILARVSTNKQDYDRQVVELTEYCNRVGWEVAEVFANKVSGAKSAEERAEIQDMIAYIKINAIQRVVVLEISRL